MPHPVPSPDRLTELLGGIDLYLLDQIMKGRIRPGQRILDAGCGMGRNLQYLMRAGLDVYGVDLNPVAVRHVQALAAGLAPHLPATHFLREPVEAMSFGDGTFDVVISNAVLHFAEDPSHFAAMLGEMGRVLAPGGLFFARLASSIGLETYIEPLGRGRYVLPDGTTRFLADDAMLRGATARLGGTLADPIKTVNVQHLRCMTTWCFYKTDNAPAP